MYARHVLQRGGPDSPVLAKGTRSSSDRNCAKGCIFNAIGIRDAFATSSVAGMQYVVRRINLGEQLPWSIAAKLVVLSGMPSRLQVPNMSW